MDSASWNSDVLDWLAEDLAATGYDLKRTMQWILTSRAYQMPAISMDEQKHPEFVFTGPVVRRMSAEQFRDALGALTGVWPGAPAAAFDLKAGVVADPKDDKLMPKPAQWIWATPKANELALAQTVYFRKTVTLDTIPATAFVTFAADNTARLLVNGKEVAKATDWTKPKVADLRPHLKKGANIFAIAAVNNTKENKPPPANVPPKESDANAGGLIFYAQLRDGARVLDFVSDGSWQSSTNEQRAGRRPPSPMPPRGRPPWRWAISCSSRGRRRISPKNSRARSPWDWRMNPRAPVSSPPIRWLWRWAVRRASRFRPRDHPRRRLCRRWS